MAGGPGARVEAKVETVFGAVDGALRTHVEGSGGVVEGVGGEGSRGLGAAEAERTDRGCGEGDALVVAYVVGLGVGAEKGAVGEGSDWGEGSGCGGGEGQGEGQVEDAGQRRGQRQHHLVRL